MAYGIDTVYSQNGEKITFAPDASGTLGGANQVAVWAGSQLRNIGIDGLRYGLGVSSVWRNFILTGKGWHRVAKCSLEGDGSCVVCIKRTHNDADNEGHKAQLLSIYNHAAIKPIYDISNMQIITKMRFSHKQSTSERFIDIYYDFEKLNSTAVVIENNVTSGSRSGVSHFWEMEDGRIVPEAMEGETVMAEMDFGDNTWLGNPM